MYECKILADSICPRGNRLTTFQVTFPRFILAEVNTHRMLSRNSASSRAIPISRALADVNSDPFVPAAFGKNEKGMVATEDIDSHDARQIWNYALDKSVHAANEMDMLGVHKAWANRLIEPYKWHTAILSGTDWDNFFALRTAANAQPEFREIATMMKEMYDSAKPNRIANPAELHLPLVSTDEILDESLKFPEPWVDWQLWARVSIGRCARVSYLTHDGKRDREADEQLHDRLRDNLHLSPFEHVARIFTQSEWDFIAKLRWEILFNRKYSNQHRDMAQRLATQIEYCGNFRGWKQARYEIPHQENAAYALHH